MNDMNTGLRSLAVLVFAHGAVIALLFQRVWAGTYSFVTPGDSIDQSFMWLSKVFAATRNGEIARWDFGVMSGTSFIGELQTSPYYPPAWLAGLFLEPGTLYAFDTFLIAHYVIAAAGMAALTRRLGMSWTATFITSSIFAYGTDFALRAAAQPNLFAGQAWLPWVVVSTIAALSAKTARRQLSACAGAGLAIALSFLAGHAHSTVLALLAASFFAPVGLSDSITRLSWVALPKLLSRIALVGLLAGAIAILVSLPQIVATVEYLHIAYKWYGPGFTSYPHIVPMEFFEKAAVGFRDLPTLITGDNVRAQDGGTFYYTRVGLAMSILPFIFFKYVGSIEKIAISCCVIGMLFAISFSFSFIKPLAYLYTNIPLVNIVRSPSRSLLIFGFCGAILAGFGIDTALKWLQWVVSRFAPAASLPVRALAAFAISLGTLAEIRDHLPDRIQFPVAISSSAVRSTLENRVTQTLLQLSRSAGSVYRFYSPREIVPPNIGDIYPLLSAHGYRSSRLTSYHEYFSFDPHSARADALGIRWWVSKMPIDGLPLAATVGDVRIYERPTALPVLWKVDAAGQRSAVALADARWGFNEVTFKLAHPQSGPFAFGQVSYPGWRAVVDGYPAQPTVIDGFMAVDVRSDITTIRFIYEPMWWKPSLAVSTLAALVVAGLLLLAAFNAFPPSRRRRACSCRPSA